MSKALLGSVPNNFLNPKSVNGLMYFSFVIIFSYFLAKISSFSEI
jgi:hypothetical protein